MMRNGLGLAMALALGMVTAGSVRAGVVAQYNFNASGAGQLAASTVDPNATAGSVNFTGSGATQFAFSGSLAINAATGATSAPTGVSTSSYYQFTITPNAGYELDLTSLDFKAATGTPPWNVIGYVVRSSVDSYAADLQTGTVPTQYSSFSSFTVSLAGAAFQNLTSAVTFRIYSFKGAGSNPALTYDDVTVNGTVAPLSPPPGVPEPATLSLVGVAAGIGLARLVVRRRGDAARA